MTDDVQQQWRDMVTVVTAQMRAHVMPFLTPISQVITHDEGELLGTGAYCTYSGRRYLLTNEHVGRELQRGSLAHQFHGSDDVIRLARPFLALGYPEDIAASVIDNAIWNTPQHQAQSIPKDRFAVRHAPVDGEILFFAGFSGARSRFLFGSLVSRGTPYATQEVPLPEGFKCDPQFHFALDYRPDLAESVGGGPAILPDPHGLSGSLVWDTKAVARTTDGKEWGPEDAVVTGILWGWPSSAACVVSTRVEYIHPFLASLNAGAT